MHRYDGASTTAGAKPHHAVADQTTSTGVIPRPWLPSAATPAHAWPGSGYTPWSLGRLEEAAPLEERALARTRMLRACANKAPAADPATKVALCAA